MRVLAGVIIMACLCLGPAGCALFNKRSGGDRSAAADKAKPIAAPRGENTDPLLTSTGMLGGQILDLDNAHPSETFIRVVCLDDGKKEEPYEVASDAQGYFTIYNLKKGKQYKLVARAKQNGHMLAGITYATAPNPRLVIKLSENYASADIPPIPRPSELGKTPATEKAQEKPANPPERAAGLGSNWEPGIGSLTVPQPARPNDLPAAPSGPGWGQAAPQPPPSGWKQNIAGKDPNRPPDPLAAINGLDPKVGGLPQPPTSTPPSMGPAPVPSCVLVGKQLVNFALPDLSGGNWEWRTNRRGKVVLIDFWRTACPPCVEAIPNLTVLQWEFGRSGLEVVSIACESDGTPQEQAYRVASLAQRKRTNYRLLLASGRDNPVVTQFGVHRLPTLVLLDESGEIVWRHEGGLGRSDLEVLRRQIKNRLDGQ